MPATSAFRLFSVLNIHARVAFSFPPFSSKVPMIAITLCYRLVYLTTAVFNAVFNAVLGQEIRSKVKRNDLGGETLSSKILNA